MNSAEKTGQLPKESSKVQLEETSFMLCYFLDCLSETDASIQQIVSAFPPCLSSADGP